MSNLDAKQAAKLIRSDLKKHFPQTKFSVRSAHYTTVRIGWTNNESIKEIEKLTARYEMGQFNGMTDSYDYSNSRNDIPQVKYVFCERTLTDDVTKKIDEMIDLHYIIHNFADRLSTTHRITSKSIDEINAWIEDIEETERKNAAS